MGPTEELTFVFPSDQVAQAFSHWFWHHCERTADELSRNRVRVSVFSHRDRIVTIEKAAGLNGQLVDEQVQPH